MATRIVQGNLQPYFYFTIAGTANLTDAVVTCTMLDIDDTKVINNSAVGCYITDVIERQAEYRWQAGDTDLSGTFRIYFTITPFEETPFDTDTFTLEIIANGSDEIITVEDIERQIKYNLSNQSDHIIQLIQAVRENCEAITRRCLKPTQKVLNLNQFPGCRGVIEIPNPPLRSIESIVYFDTDGIEQTIDSSLYRVVLKNQNPAQPSYVMPIYGTSWPTALYDVDSISINYTCGYGTVINSESIPETLELPKAIKQWILINVANLYDNPETIQIGNANRMSVIEVPSIADGLIANYKIVKW